MFQKVLLGGAFGVLTTIGYRFCIGKLNIFAINGNDHGEESMNSQVFRSKKGQFVNKKNSGKKCTFAGEANTSQSNRAKSISCGYEDFLTRNQEVIQTTFLYTSDIISTFVYTLIYTVHLRLYFLYLYTDKYIP